MVNAVNSARNVPELGARREYASPFADVPVQDVRKEAARLIERHKRALTEGGVAMIQPQRSSNELAMQLLLKSQAAPAKEGAQASEPTSSAPATNDNARGLETSDGEVSTSTETPTACTDVKTAERLDALALRAQGTGGAGEQPAEQPVVKPGDTQEQKPQSQVQPQVHDSPLASTALQSGIQQQIAAARGEPSFAARVPGATGDAKALLQSAPVLAEVRGATAVFDVPLRGLGAQQSTQVSLHLASGQVVLTPSSERAAEVLLNAAQATDWVNVGDSTEERNSRSQQQDADEEDGQ